MKRSRAYIEETVIKNSETDLQILNLKVMIRGDERFLLLCFISVRIRI